MVRHARLVPSAHNKCSTGAWNEHGKHVGEGREQGRKRAGTRRHTTVALVNSAIMMPTKGKKASS